MGKSIRLAETQTTCHVRSYMSHLAQLYVTLSRLERQENVLWTFLANRPACHAGQTIALL